jgi:hypothetical protein
MKLTLISMTFNEMVPLGHYERFLYFCCGHNEIDHQVKTHWGKRLFLIIFFLSIFIKKNVMIYKYNLAQIP